MKGRHLVLYVFIFVTAVLNIILFHAKFSQVKRKLYHKHKDQFQKDSSYVNASAQCRTIVLEIHVRARVAMAFWVGSNTCLEMATQPLIKFEGRERTGLRENFLSFCRTSPCVLKGIKPETEYDFLLTLQKTDAAKCKGNIVNQRFDEITVPNASLGSLFSETKEECCSACAKASECVAWEWRDPEPSNGAHDCACFWDPSMYTCACCKAGACACPRDAPNECTVCTDNRLCYDSSPDNCRLFRRKLHLLPNTEANEIFFVYTTPIPIVLLNSKREKKLYHFNEGMPITWEDAIVDKWWYRKDSLRSETCKEHEDLEYPENIKEIQSVAEVKWKSLPNIPKSGRQDMAGCFIDGFPFFIGGFNNGACGGGVNFPITEELQNSDGEDGEALRKRFRRGFYNDTYYFDAKQNLWNEVENFPGQPRQLPAYASGFGACYVVGGFSYAPADLSKSKKKSLQHTPKKSANAYMDGYKLSRNEEGDYVWENIPDLPIVMAGGGLALDERRLYLLGGVDYSSTIVKYQSQAFDFWTDRNGENPLGYAKLYYLDLYNLEKGWSTLALFPGTPRMLLGNLIISSSMLYVIGGMSSLPDKVFRKWREDRERRGKKLEPKLIYGLSNVKDNWKYDLITNKWTRLCNLPKQQISSFHARGMLHGRYIALVGGAHKWGYYATPDMDIVRPYNTSAGTNFMAWTPTPYSVRLDFLTDYGSDWCEHIPGATYCECASWCQKEIRCAGVVLYDTITDTYGRASPLPLNIAMPTALADGSKLTVLGGEASPGWVNGQFYGIHPDIAVEGTLAVHVKPAENRGWLSRAPSAPGRNQKCNCAHDFHIYRNAKSVCLHDRCAPIGCDGHCVPREHTGVTLEKSVDGLHGGS